MNIETMNVKLLTNKRNGFIFLVIFSGDKTHYIHCGCSFTLNKSTMHVCVFDCVSFSSIQITKQQIFYCNAVSIPTGKYSVYPLSSFYLPATSQTKTNKLYPKVKHCIHFGLFPLFFYTHIVCQFVNLSVHLCVNVVECIQSPSVIK